MYLVRAGGLSGFVDDALDLLPTDKLKALFEEKLKTSPEFKALYERLKHADFHQLVDLYQVRNWFPLITEQFLKVFSISELQGSAIPVPETA